MADLSSNLECCRDRVLHLEVFDFAIDALAHDSAEVHIAACIFLKNVFCSVKNLSAGHSMSETVVLPLVQLFCDYCMSVQISALRAINNVAVDFKPHKSLFTQSRGVSMESAIRINIVCASNRCKEEILLELTTSTLASLISDPATAIQEQALALIRNLISGTLNSIENVFGEYISFSWIYTSFAVIANCSVQVQLGKITTTTGVSIPFYVPLV
ncbi:armadillo repeat-containing protein 8-like [Dorcoceras hygrometricum]|uniref:Armadillo repeat-containing protein 8-like n=1 Tax=Dorcoceras hygrometricum TaxID=472368 RepID=A0A2Z7AT11_9LAMI|nr:armadillo repeat-containing protein 8-like [Dorcoceras hygrometricum]